MEPVAHSDSASHELLSQPELDVPQDPEQAFLYAVRRNDVAEVRQYLHRDPGLINRARVKGDRWPDDPPAKDDTLPNAGQHCADSRGVLWTCPHVPRPATEWR